MTKVALAGALGPELSGNHLSDPGPATEVLSPGPGRKASTGFTVEGTANAGVTEEVRSVGAVGATTATAVEGAVALAVGGGTPGCCAVMWFRRRPLCA